MAHSLTTLLAVANHGAGVIGLSVVGIYKVAIRAKERAPAPQVLITCVGIVLSVRHAVIGAVGVSDASANGQPVGSLNREVGGGIVTSNLVGVEVLETLTLVVAKRYVVVGASRVASHRDVVRLSGSVLVEHDASHIPVGIVSILVIVVTVYHLAISSLGVAMLFNPVVDTCLELFTVHVHTKELGGITLAVVVVDKGLYLSGHVRIVGQCGCLAPREVVLVRNLDVVLNMTSLSGDQYHTECGASTINRGRSGILQYRDALDVVGVEVRQVVGGNTVNNIQWCGSAIVGKCTDTTNHE